VDCYCANSVDRRHLADACCARVIRLILAGGRHLRFTGVASEAYAKLSDAKRARVSEGLKDLDGLLVSCRRGSKR